MNDKDSGPAFPVVVRSGSTIENGHQCGPHEAQMYGVSIRNYFAAKAMQASLSAAAYQQEWSAIGIARSAYSVADAMLEVRSE